MHSVDKIMERSTQKSSNSEGVSGGSAPLSVHVPFLSKANVNSVRSSCGIFRFPVSTGGIFVKIITFFIPMTISGF